MGQIFYEVVQFLFFISWLIIVVCTSTILIVTIHFWRRQCRSVLNLLMCNSSASLLCFAITYCIQTPYFIQHIYFKAPRPSPLYCRMTGCLGAFGTMIAAYSCLVQAIARFFITILYQHRVFLTFRTTWILILTSWIISGMIAICMLSSSSAYQYEPESHICILTTKNTVTSSIAAFLFVGVTVAILLILYVIIIHRTIRHTHINPHSASTLRARRNKRVYQNIIFSVSVHAVGSSPYIICIILNSAGQAPWYLYSVSNLSLSIASAIHAVFLLSLNDQVKKIIRERLLVNRITALITMTLTRKNRVATSDEQIKAIQLSPYARN